MTLIGFMTADARYLCGSWFLWPSQFGRKLVLGTRRKWPRPRRHVGSLVRLDTETTTLHLPRLRPAY